MNRFGTIVVLACGLVLARANLDAESRVAGAADNPYSFIAVRNVFGLNTPPSLPEHNDSTPPPKITLTGITTVFGPSEVLYNVAGDKQDGKQWKDKSYILKEGQEQDGVGVVKIDIEKDVVTFRNHGVRQDIALANGLSAAGELFAVTSPSGGRNPKPGDYDYTAQQSVTAPLNENQRATIETQPSQYQDPADSPASDPPTQSAPVNNGESVTGGDTPPGHGGF